MLRVLSGSPLLMNKRLHPAAWAAPTLGGPCLDPCWSCRASQGAHLFPICSGLFLCNQSQKICQPHVLLHILLLFFKTSVKMAGGGGEGVIFTLRALENEPLISPLVFLANLCFDLNPAGWGCLWLLPLGTVFEKLLLVAGVHV